MKRANQVPDLKTPSAGEIFNTVEDRVFSDHLIFPAYHYLKAFLVPRWVAIDALACTIRLREEFKDAIEGLDPQVVEAYRFMSKYGLVTRLRFLERVVSDFERYISERP